MKTTVSATAAAIAAERGRRTQLQKNSGDGAQNCGRMLEDATTREMTTEQQPHRGGDRIDVDDRGGASIAASGDRSPSRQQPDIVEKRGE